jgi:cytochrome b561
MRYHPLLLTLHWLLAGLLIMSLYVGFFGLAATPNSDPTKLDMLRWHMAVGMGILALTLLRLVVRVRTVQPQGRRRWLHFTFYLLIALMAGTGLATAVIAHLNDIVFAGSGDPLPPTLMVYPTRVVHGYLALLLVGCIALHLVLAGPRMARTASR